MVGFARITEHPWVVLVKEDERLERELGEALGNAAPDVSGRSSADSQTSAAVTGAGFRGELTSRNLLELVQLVAMTMSTGALHLVCAEGCGTMWIDEGMIVHAQTADQRGATAFQRMLHWGRGSFHIESGASAPERSITFTTTQLLLEGARMLDEEEAGERPIAETGTLSVKRTPAEHFERGLEAVHDKRYSDALGEWERALALDPDNRVYQHNLRRLRLMIERGRERPAPGGGQ